MKKTGQVSPEKFKTFLSKILVSRSISPQPKPGSRGRNRNRKPYHFKNRFQNPDSAPSSVAIDPDDEAEEATYFRFRYYQRLRGNPPPPHSDETLVSPAIIYYLIGRETYFIRNLWLWS